ncbi:MAG TPA: hypothetical protein VHB46_16420 [Burkholderiales bacterium]|nr:hypothetical protein [Burkholderiales bacterium]
MTAKPSRAVRGWLLVAALVLSFFTGREATAVTTSRAECANPPPGAIFCEDFEGANPKANFNDYDGNLDSENQVITDAGPSGEAANKVIRLRAPAGQRGGADLIKVFSTPYDRLYARWYFKYEAGFNFAAPDHGGGLAAGNRDFVGRSGYRPTGADFAGFYVQYQQNTRKPHAYSYYRGMYQDCADPMGSCWGDALPCVSDTGGTYCTVPQDRPPASYPLLEAGVWYCLEEMVDMGTPTSSRTSANGHLALWLNDQPLGSFGNLWIRTTDTLKLQSLWLSLFHHDGTHSVVGELIDNVVVSTQRIGCNASQSTISPPKNFRVVQ